MSSKRNNCVGALSLIFCLFICVNAQVKLDEFFQNCRVGTETFDECLKDGLNNLRPLYKVGLPDYGILPFDPLFTAEVAQKRGGPFFNYKLVLKNVTETGWTQSQLTKLKYDLHKKQLVYTQFFPDKRLSGIYEVEGTIMGSKIRSKGSWNLKLFDYVQTSTISRKTAVDKTGKLHNDTPIKIFIASDSCKNLELHIDNLLGGRAVLENVLDRLINTAWQPGLTILKPLINDMVSRAFTEILNTSFRKFPFEQIFH